MKGQIIKYGLTIATACAALLQPSLLPQIGQWPQAPSAAAATSAQASVELEKGTSMYVRDAGLLMQDQQLVLAFTVTIANNSGSELDLLDYWVTVSGKSGKVYKAILAQTDQTKKKLSSSSSVNLTYYATVDSGVRLRDLTLKVMAFDLSATNFERTLGTLTYPEETTSGTPVFQPDVLLINNAKVKGAIKQYFVTQDQDGMSVTISYLVENIGLSSVELSNIGLALQTESYSVFDVDSQALSELTLQPKERKIVTVQAKLPNAVVGKSIVLLPYRRDEASGLRLPIGQFAIPLLQPAPAVTAGAIRKVYMNGVMVQTRVGRVTVRDEDEETEIDVAFAISNTGNEAIALPDLEFELQTTAGIAYPLTYAPDTDKTTLLPQIERTLTLSGTLPASAWTGAEVVVRTSGVAAVDGSSSGSGYLLGMYKLPAPHAQEGGVGSTYVHDSGYEVRIASIQRTTSTDSDALTAELTITNRSDASIKPPDLSGYFVVNGVRVAGTSRTAALDPQLDIAAGDSIRQLVYIPIPYTTEIEEVAFILTEQSESDESIRRFQFNEQQLTPYSEYSESDGYVVGAEGARSRVQVHATRLFEGSLGRTFYTEFEVTNEELRAAQTASLAAYIEDGNGQLATLQLTSMTEKVKPGGTILLSGWSNLSKTFDSHNYKLIFGQSLPDELASSGEEEVLVRPVVYNVHEQQPELNTTLSDIAFSAYKLTLRDVVGNLHVTGAYSVEGIRLEMAYDLEVDETYDYVAGGHKLRIEFVNQDQIGVTYAQEVELAETSSDAQTLVAGSDQPLELRFSDSAVQGKIADYDTFEINVYDVYDGAELLIASKEINWFGRSE
ncbi:hypothetical protein IDH44_11660 [Paenibacillus sp. IB182496]|uniref:DUF916 domain-containing protein n=1 Tax=Paenibacillus sabuli TaxID=2772509 RepID=A0A927GRN7_9BACL|nr:hypothetical protein [Paenibacillus sabuli]MBD2845849.1 hypothetical protein [Paenibacillus sabuli]